MKIKFYLISLIMLITNTVFSDEIIYLNPSQALSPIIFDNYTLADPSDNLVIHQFYDNSSIKIAPKLITDMDKGKKVIPILYLYSKTLNIGYLIQGSEFTIESDETVINLLPDIYPMSALKDVSLDIYYGYIVDNTLKYNTYRNSLISIYNDINYNSSSTSARHNLDIYKPEGYSNNKVIFFVIGGAWKQGEKSTYKELGLTLSSYGYTVAIPNYRLSNDNDGNALHTDHINDVADAFSWVYNNISSYSGNNEKIYIFGQSAGAHLSSLLASDTSYLKARNLTSENICGIISMSGTYQLYDFSKYPINPLGLSGEEVIMYKYMFENAFGSWEKDVLDNASPQNYISSSIPPFFLITTENDMPGFIKSGENFFSALNNISGINNSNLSYYKISLSDYSIEAWNAATAMASAEPALSQYIGHYAELAAINTTEPNNMITKMIVDFIEKY